MHKKYSVLAVLVLALAMIAAPAMAGHPEEDPNPCGGTVGGDYVSHDRNIKTPSVRTSVIAITDTNRGPFYFDARDLASEYWGFSIWLYQETNTVNRLQRGGAAITPATPATNNVDPCWEATARPGTACDVRRATCHDQAIF